MAELTTAEKYALAQILLCGKIDYEEFRSMNNFLGEVQKETIRDLRKRGLLEETLFQDK